MEFFLALVNSLRPGRIDQPDQKVTTSHTTKSGGSLNVLPIELVIDSGKHVQKQMQTQMAIGTDSCIYLPIPQQGTLLAEVAVRFSPIELACRPRAFPLSCCNALIMPYFKEIHLSD